MDEDYIFETEQKMKPKDKRLCIYCKGEGKGVMPGRAKNKLMCAECMGSGKQWVTFMGVDFGRPGGDFTHFGVVGFKGATVTVDEELSIGRHIPNIGGGKY
jgi:hypothetical protein